jgi:hypothetical protein
MHASFVPHLACLICAAADAGCTQVSNLHIMLADSGARAATDLEKLLDTGQRQQSCATIFGHQCRAAQMEVLVITLFVGVYELRC